MKNQNKAYIYAIITVLLWSTVASAFKISLRHMDFTYLLFFSSGVSFIALLFVNLFCSFKRRESFFKQQILYQTKKDVLRSAVTGFINPFFYYLVLFKSYSMLPAQITQTINYTWPIILTLMSVPFLKQKLSFRTLIALLISFVGIVFISSRGNLNNFLSADLTGVLLALFSTVIWSLFWISNILDKREEAVKLMMNFFFGFSYISIFIFFFSSKSFVLPKMEGLLAVTYVGLFEMGLTFLIWSKALKYSETTAKVSNFIFVTPFLSLIILSFTINESIQTSTIIGLIFIVFGLIIQRKKK